MTGPRVSSAERLGIVMDLPQLEAEADRQSVGRMVNDLVAAHAVDGDH